MSQRSAIIYVTAKLPAWLKSAKLRDEILKAVQRLKHGLVVKLPDCSEPLSGW